MQENSQYVHLSLKTTNKAAILNIIKFFTKSFKGMNFLNFKLWAKANHYKNFIEMTSDRKRIKIIKIYEILKKIELKFNSNKIYQQCYFHNKLLVKYY